MTPALSLTIQSREDFFLARLFGNRSVRDAFALLGLSADFGDLPLTERPSEQDLRVGLSSGRSSLSGNPWPGDPVLRVATMQVLEAVGMFTALLALGAMPDDSPRVLRYAAHLVSSLRDPVIEDYAAHLHPMVDALFHETRAEDYQGLGARLRHTEVLAGELRVDMTHDAVALAFLADLHVNYGLSVHVSAFLREFETRTRQVKDVRELLGSIPDLIEMGRQNPDELGPHSPIRGLFELLATRELVDNAISAWPESTTHRAAALVYRERLDWAERVFAWSRTTISSAIENAHRLARNASSTARVVEGSQALGWELRRPWDIASGEAEPTA